MSMNSNLDQAAVEQAARMDDIYGLQRHVYDATRAHYLLGRDGLLANLDVPAGGSILEVGCGTGRNLVRAARRYPDVKLFGLDISQEMLQSAGKSILQAGIESRTKLGLADAAKFDARQLFKKEKFDRVIFSYTLSMIPNWRGALQQGLEVLAPHGSLHLVDFGGCEQLPSWFRSALYAWLGKFHVTPRAEIEAYLQELAAAKGLRLEVAKPFRGYAIAATLGFK